MEIKIIEKPRYVPPDYNKRPDFGLDHMLKSGLNVFTGKPQVPVESRKSDDNKSPQNSSSDF